MSRTSGRSASRLAAILDALPDALLLADASGTVVNANAVALELFEGESAERLLGKPIVALLPGLGRAVATAGPGPAALPAGSSTSAGVPQGPARSPAERLAARRTDGTLFPAEVNTAKLPDDGDELTLFVVRDLTGVLDVEAELRRQQRQIELILRAASEGIIGIDNEGRIVLVNPAGARILRHRASDLGGQDVHELIAHSSADGTPISPDKVLIVDSLRSGTKHRSVDEVLWRSDGTAVTVDITTAPVYEGDVIIGAVMTFADNSETRAAARRARELAEVLEDELRAPLGGVLGELRNVAEYGIGELGPNVRQALASASSDLAEVCRLVDDIVDYQHMVIGDTPCEPRRIALSAVVDAAVEATDADAAALGVDLIAHTADVEVCVDPQLFATMLAHLLADMVNASPVGGKVVVTAARRGPVARIEIRGPHTGGGPLHLPIARAIVAHHGGTVTTHRIAGKGNTHVVEIPVDGSAGGGKGTARAIAGGPGSANAAAPDTAASAAGSNPGTSRFGGSGRGTGNSGPSNSAGASTASTADSRASSVVRIRPVSRVRAPSSNGDEAMMTATPIAAAPSGPVPPGPGPSSSAPVTSTAPAAPGAPAAAGTTGQVKQVEKTNGHHTSHGADARRPVIAASGTNGQARIPAQARSSLSRSSGSIPLDLKPSKPLPTSDVWTRPQRGQSDPPTQEINAVDTVGPNASSVHDNGTTAGDRATEVTEPNEQQPWQPQAEAVVDERPAGESSVAKQSTTTVDRPDEDAKPRGRRRAVSAEPATQSTNAAVVSHPTREGEQSTGERGPGERVAIEQEPPAQAAPEVDVRDARTGRLGVVDDEPTQVMPPLVITDARTAQSANRPGFLRAVPGEVVASRDSGKRESTVADGVPAQASVRESASAVDDARQTPKFGPVLMLWPEPDPSTLDLLDERGYEAVALDDFDTLPRALDELARQRLTKPSAVLVDPIAAPITRRGLRILRGAAVNANLPIVVTAGIGGGPAESPQGPDPALLLQALTPPGVSLPRVLLIEARDDLAEAMTHALERQGMQVLSAMSDAESIDRASNGVPDVVLMDLMQVRRRRTGIVEWLRDHDRLTTTPIVVYTALSTDSPQFANSLRSGNAVLYLAERSTDVEVGNRIGDLLAKVCPN